MSRLYLFLLKPTIQGKRAITDGSGIHFASYCAKLRDVGETCSTYNTNAHYYSFHCPCKRGLTCKGTVVQLHPLLSVTPEATCRL